MENHNFLRSVTWEAVSAFCQIRSNVDQAAASHLK